MKAQWDDLARLVGAALQQQVKAEKHRWQHHWDDGKHKWKKEWRRGAAWSRRLRAAGGGCGPQQRAQHRQEAAQPGLDGELPRRPPCAQRRPRSCRRRAQQARLSRGA